MTKQSAAGASLRPVIFGEVLFDRFPDGTAVLGGAPFNVAWNLQAFGLQPLFISRIGDDDLGKQVHSAMQAWGMDLAGLQTDPQHPTGVVDVSFHDGEPHYNIVSDSAWDFIHPDGLPELPENSLLYHGSLALRQPVSRITCEYLQHLEAPRFIDINLRTPWWNRESLMPGLSGVQWLKINADELAEIVPQENDADSRIQHLLDTLTPQWLIVTQGKEGALAVSTAGERLHVKPEQATQVIDTVGAGDSFSSILILGLTRGWPMEQTLQRAQQFASAIVGLRGATTQQRDFYQPFIDDWQLA